MCNNLISTPKLYIYIYMYVCVCVRERESCLTSELARLDFYFSSSYESVTNKYEWSRLMRPGESPICIEIPPKKKKKKKEKKKEKRFGLGRSN
jgi:hypothetical protein